MILFDDDDEAVNLAASLAIESGQSPLPPFDGVVERVAEPRGHERLRRLRLYDVEVTYAIVEPVRRRFLVRADSVDEAERKAIELGRHPETFTAKIMCADAGRERILSLEQLAAAVARAETLV